MRSTLSSKEVLWQLLRSKFIISPGCWAITAVQTPCVWLIDSVLLIAMKREEQRRLYFITWNQTSFIMVCMDWQQATTIKNLLESETYQLMETTLLWNQSFDTGSASKSRRVTRSATIPKGATNNSWDQGKRIIGISGNDRDSGN